MSDDSHTFLPISRFDYELPPELIAQTPVEPRDASRLLVVDRRNSSIEDRQFRDLPEILEPGDLLVMNDTRVLPARLFARRSTGGQVELLFLEQVQPDIWNVLARPARRLKAQEQLTVVDADGVLTSHTCTVGERTDAGTLHVHLRDSMQVMQQHGQMPLPPYVSNKLDDPERYQTVYAQTPGSAAAPTAGLHFTEDLLNRCAARGICTTTITLHVGLDTFQPVKDENALDHKMHSEWYRVKPHALELIRATRQNNRRIVAVGTTVARTLESIGGSLDSASTELGGATDIYIIPPYTFANVDCLITNFHLPRTTLLLMVSALAGETLIRQAYAHAVANRYRFYSFGDAMIIV